MLRDRRLVAGACAIGVATGLVGVGLAVDSPQASPIRPSAPAPGPIQNPATRAPIILTASGQTFAVAASVGDVIDGSRAVLVAGSVNGRAYVTAPSKERVGEECFVEIPASKAEEDTVIGCDPTPALKAKGGWLISHPGSKADTKSGVLILPAGLIAVSVQTASGQSLPVNGRVAVFRDLPQATSQLEVATSAGAMTIAFPKP